MTRLIELVGGSIDGERWAITDEQWYQGLWRVPVLPDIKWPIDEETGLDTLVPRYLEYARRPDRPDNRFYLATLAPL